jgi:hypothetical protein
MTTLVRWKQAEEVCAKCGNTSLAVRWIDAVTNQLNPGQEALVVTCTFCTYSWQVAPLDVAPA